MQVSFRLNRAHITPVHYRRSGAAGSLPAIDSSCRHSSLSFRRVLPPRSLRRSLDEPNNGNERVEQARIVAVPSDSAQIVIHRIRITSRQIGGHADSQQAKVGGDGGTYIREVFETGKLLPPFCYSSFHVLS